MEDAEFALEESLDETQEDLDADSELQNDISAEEDSSYIKMDYSLENPEDAVKKVEEIIANTPSEKLTPLYLDRLAQYIIDIDIKVRKRNKEKQKEILTNNRMVTVNKRETSFEGLVGKLENGEDGIYNMMAGEDKNILFQPKVEITADDVEKIPGMKELREEIKKVEERCGKVRGKKAYALRKQLIEMRQQQYVLKNAYVKPFRPSNITKSFCQLNLIEHISMDNQGKVISDGIVNFYDISHIKMLLSNYSKLKEDSWDRLTGDAKWMMIDFENLVDNALKDKYPIYYAIVIYKIDGKQNAEIQDLIEQEFGVRHSVEYISSLWKNKIPKIIVEEASKEWIEYHYTYEVKGLWKKCSRCGQIKPAHNLYFSKNKTSKDNFYSICKCCRNTKINNNE